MSVMVSSHCRHLQYSFQHRLRGISHGHLNYWKNYHTKKYYFNGFCTLARQIKVKKLTYNIMSIFCIPEIFFTLSTVL